MTSDESSALSGGLQLVELSHVVALVAEGAYDGLRDSIGGDYIQMADEERYCSTRAVKCLILNKLCLARPWKA